MLKTVLEEDVPGEQYPSKLVQPRREADLVRGSSSGERAFDQALTFKQYLSAPVADFLQTFAARMLEEPHQMAGVFELVDVGPNFGLPSLFVGGGFSAGGAAGVQRDGHNFQPDRSGSGSSTKMQRTSSISSLAPRRCS